MEKNSFGVSYNNIGKQTGIKFHFFKNITNARNLCERGIYDTMLQFMSCSL